MNCLIIILEPHSSFPFIILEPHSSFSFTIFCRRDKMQFKNLSRTQRSLDWTLSLSLEAGTHPIPPTFSRFPKKLVFVRSTSTVQIVLKLITLLRTVTWQEILLPSHSLRIWARMLSWESLLELPLLMLPSRKLSAAFLCSRSYHHL